MIVGKNRDVVFSAEHYKAVRIKRKSGGFYFDGQKLFEDRDEDFQNFMYNYLFGGPNIDKRLSQISSYVRSFEYSDKISADYSLAIADNISNNNNVVVVNGLHMGQNDEMDVNSFFQSHLLRIPYRISSDDFIGITYERDLPNRDYDYLIPLNVQGLSLLEKGADCVCQVRKMDVVIKLTYNGKTYTKVYEENPQDITKGIIKDFGKDKQYINIGSN